MIIEGIVVHGNSLGGRMGFPTANIEADAALDARDGVYASRVEVDGRMYDAMSNLGYKPTVDGRRRGRRPDRRHVFSRGAARGRTPR